MEYWEHLHVTLEYIREMGYAIRREDGLLKGLDADAYIQRLGADGWQMVGVVSWPGEGPLPDQMLWFKRVRWIDDSETVYLGDDASPGGA